ncbi:hypothetical protein KSP39_PZI014527 [Platanthera zijinensis]|uniref:Uncharacterized protein n=1 Tax=Platanthera zijinensis TaxID=2320716 RepID=A0AAP0BBS3_9ASPA
MAFHLKRRYKYEIINPREKGQIGTSSDILIKNKALQKELKNLDPDFVMNKVEITQVSWFDPLQDLQGKYSGLISNPSYIPSSHIPGLQAEIGRHEPSLA